MTGKLLWTSVPVNLNRPAHLFSPGRLPQIEEWRSLNLWASSISLSAFSGGELKSLPLTERFQLPIEDGIPYLAHNVPASSWVRWDREHGGKSFHSRLARYGEFVRAVAWAIPRGPVWIVNAHDDGGACAIATAAARGYAIALSDEPPGEMAAVLSHDADVLIESRERSDFRL